MNLKLLNVTPDEKCGFNFCWWRTRGWAEPCEREREALKGACESVISIRGSVAVSSLAPCSPPLAPHAALAAAGARPATAAGLRCC